MKLSELKKHINEFISEEINTRTEEIGKSVVAQLNSPGYEDLIDGISFSEKKIRFFSKIDTDNQSISGVILRGGVVKIGKNFRPINPINL